MRKDYEKLFTHLISPEPPVGLFEKIMLRIREERRLLTIKRRLAVFSIGTVLSAAAFIPIFKSFQTELYKSGFLQFLSLAFSDFGIVASYWRNFAMSLLETIPAMNLAMFFATIFVFLGSLKFLTKDIKLVFIEICFTVKEEIENSLNELKNDAVWEEIWNRQTSDFLQVSWSILPIGKKNEYKSLVDTYKTFGCASAIAATSMYSVMLTENDGMTLDEALKVKPQDVMRRLGGLPNRKIHCSVLAEQALCSALADYFRKKDLPLPEKLARAIKRLEGQEHNHHKRDRSIDSYPPEPKK